MNQPDAILQIIAVEVVNSNHGDFLKHFANAWLKTDRANKVILKPAWLMLVNKYQLEEEYFEAIERHLEEYIHEA